MRGSVPAKTHSALQAGSIGSQTRTAHQQFLLRETGRTRRM